MLRSLQLLPLAFYLAFSLPAAAAPDSSIKGEVIVAKTQGNAIVLWDITQSVAALVATPSSHDEKIRDVELQASEILLAHLAEMSAASTVEVRALYQRNGDVSPIYKTATFAGVERLLTITATYAAAVKNKAAWEKQLAAGAMPSGITVEVTGDLPPR
ncbi:MAG TPA: hypothetical protein VGG89_04120 [Candidatus Baltobacteraceae bacterium]|jgi:hypothetical protein